MKRLRSFIVMLLCLTISCTTTVSFADTNTNTKQDGIFQQDNFLKISNVKAWESGEIVDLSIVKDVGDGALRLAKGEVYGKYLSPVIDVPDFEYLVASWNADTPENTSIQVFARVYVDKHDTWTEWLSWGKWGTGTHRASESPIHERVCIDTDTLVVLGENDETASKIQFKVYLESEDPSVTPTFRQVCATMKNTLKGQEIPVYQPDNLELPESVLLDTPSYSQMNREPAYGNIMCSATSMTMMLNDRNPQLDLFPEEVGLRIFDNSYNGFGNWAFTVAGAGSYGYNSYVHYADFDFLRQELANGRSVGISVHYSNSKDGNNPYLENGASNDTDGHLIVVVGYETVNGKDYFICNDPADLTDGKCAHRKYSVEQLDEAWDNRVAYVVSKNVEKNAGQDQPRRLSCKVEKNEDDAWQLLLDGEPVKLEPPFSSLDTTMFLISDEEKVDKALKKEDIKTTTANRQGYYYSYKPGEDYQVTLLEDVDSKEIKGTLYIITSEGPTYIADVKYENPNAPAEKHFKHPILSIGGILGLATIGILIGRKKKN